MKTGDFVKYKMKNEIGLVSEVKGNTLLCWWHMGGTRAHIDFDLVEKQTISQVLNNVYSNEYVKASLFERRARLFEGTDVSDLIDERHIRKNFLKGERVNAF